MDISKTVENVSTSIELKRIASAYVIDYRNLNDQELKKAIIKNSPQYSFKANVAETISWLFLNEDRNIRIISRLILKEVLLQKDDFMCPEKETEDDIISYEQSIIKRSNEALLQRSSERSKSLELFKFVLETAWQYNDSISPDEKNLIEKIKNRLKVTDIEYELLEAKLGKYPKPGNEIHTRREIEEVRRIMQTKGLVFSLRDSDGTDFDIIPTEIARTIRKVLHVEIRKYGYKELLSYKYVRSKKYYLDILAKYEIPIEGSMTIDALQEIFLEQVPPSVLLGGISPKDGLDSSDLSKWCGDLKLNVSGPKKELIQRIIAYYDNILEKEEVVGDERERWYKYFQKFAARDLKYLRNQHLLQKDLECERKFEEATNYLFEKKLYLQPLKLIGTSHADGALSYLDKVIYWDNKSKETPVNLNDHIKQFDYYIKNSEKPVACFFVIGPDFTQESSLLAMKYRVENQTTITLITAKELKTIAETWSSKKSRKQEDPFPLGYLIQPGRFNIQLLDRII